MRRALALGLLGLAAVQVAAVLLWVRPGPLSVDEVLYQWMTRSVVEGHGLTIDNGYAELPSRELGTTEFMYARDGKLTSQYPYFFPWLAAPFYALMGFLGLFLVNALAFVGVVALTYRIGWRLLGDRTVALLGAAVLAAGTFAWEYSMAAWPHMVTLLTQVGAFALMLEALLGDGERAMDAGDGAREGEARRRAWAAAAAGFVLAVGVGFRRDAIFFLPVLALPLLYHRPVRGRELAALFVGTLPPLAALAAVNVARWGIVSPLSYGRSQSWTLPVAAVGAVGVVVLALLALRPVQGFVLRHHKPALLAVLVVALVAAWAPPTRAFAQGVVSGVEALVFDLRGTAVEVGGGQQRTYWAVVYLGMLKKSVLQSLPWLPLIAVPLVVAARRPALRWKAALLLLPALAYIPPQAIYERHGGLSANLRYFIPTLPFLALLAGWAVEEVRAAAGATWARVGVVAGGGGAVALAGWLVVRPAGFETPREAQTAALDAPLVLAAMVALAVAWWAVRWWRVRDGGAPPVLLLLAAGATLTWAALLGFDYDARWARAVRTTNLVRAYELAELVEPGSLVLTTYQDYHGSLPELVDDVIVAFPHGDDYRDFRRLVFHHLGVGRPVYAAMAHYEWVWVQEQGLLEGMEMREVAAGPVRVMEFRRAEAGDGGRGGG